MNSTISEYAKRVNEVINYVEENLTEDITLETMAELGSYSPFHFHRVFSMIKGESPVAFLRRKRLELAAWTILKDKRIKIIEVAEKYGFENYSAFSKAFKKFYKLSPSQMRSASESSFNKISRKISKNGKEQISIENYFANVDDFLSSLNISMSEFEIGVFEKKEFMAIRNQGDFGLSDEAFLELNRLAAENEIPKQEESWALVIHDNPAVTEDAQVEHSACLRIDKSYRINGSTATTLVIPKGKYAVGQFNISNSEFKDAWGLMSIHILKQGLEYRDGIYYESFATDSVLEPDAIHNTKLYIPIS